MQTDLSIVKTSST